MQVRNFLSADVQKSWISAGISTLPGAEGKEVFTVALSSDIWNHVPTVK